MKKKLFLGLCLFVTAASAIAQSPCGDFHKRKCPRSEDDKFVYDAQSKSGLFGSGQTSDLRMIIYKGLDYRISICADDLFGKDVKFKIKDAKTGEVMYDNTTDKMVQEVEFSSENTRSILIQVTVPEVSMAGKDNKGKKPKDAKGDKDKKPAPSSEKLAAADGACVGMLVEHKMSDKTGFQ